MQTRLWAPVLAPVKEGRPYILIQADGRLGRSNCSAGRWTVISITKSTFILFQLPVQRKRRRNASTQAIFLQLAAATMLPAPSGETRGGCGVLRGRRIKCILQVQPRKKNLPSKHHTTTLVVRPEGHRHASMAEDAEFSEVAASNYKNRKEEISAVDTQRRGASP